ncbi:MAG: hypothetical protein AAF802_02005 [Planctomycetota bacterium]
MSSFIEDGFENLEDGIREEKRREVLAKYTQQMNTVGWWGRMRLRWRIKHEVDCLVANELEMVSGRSLF